jgi:hypothetical protein
MGRGIATVCDRTWLPPVVVMLPDDRFRRHWDMPGEEHRHPIADGRASRLSVPSSETLCKRAVSRGAGDWSPRGAHRVLQVRAAALDGRFGQQAIQLAA